MVPILKNEKHNLIGDIIFRIITLVVTYSVMTFEPPLWFNIIFPLLVGMPVVTSFYKLHRKDKDKDK